MGLSPFTSPLKLWLEKTGRRERPDLSDNEAVEMGQRLEALIADVFAEREQVKVRREGATLVHPEFPWWRGRIDRRVLNQAQRTLLECKNTSEYQRHKWGVQGSDDVPDFYAVQVHSYFPLGTGFDVGCLAVLIGGRNHRRYRLERDSEVEHIITDAVLAFRDALERDIHPPPINSADMELLFPDALADCIEATGEVLADISKLQELNGHLKELKAAKEEVVERLKMVIGPHAGLVDPEGNVAATWKTVNSHRLDAKALRGEHPELMAQYTRATKYRRFLG
jgi:putative phage-type endonuclease